MQSAARERVPLRVDERQLKSEALEALVGVFSAAGCGGIALARSIRLRSMNAS